MEREQELIVQAAAQIAAALVNASMAKGGDSNEDTAVNQAARIARKIVKAVAAGP